MTCKSQKILIRNCFFYAHLKIVKRLDHVKTVNNTWFAAWSDNVARQITLSSSLMEFDGLEATVAVSVIDVLATDTDISILSLQCCIQVCCWK